MFTEVLGVFPYMVGFVTQPMAIQQQPITAPSTTVVRPSSGDNYLTLSVVMTFLVFILGGWPSLLCSISALLISCNVRVDRNVIQFLTNLLLNHFFVRQGMKKVVVTLQLPGQKPTSHWVSMLSQWCSL